MIGQNHYKGPIMIKTKLTKTQKEELINYRKHASSQDSEKALMVLLNSKGSKPENIAKRLDRNAHTVRLWLKRYAETGIGGLKRKMATGRPKVKKLNCINLMNEFINQSPEVFGYIESVWNVPLIKDCLEKTKAFSVSEDTIERALKNLGYTFKRPAKAVGPKAPSPAMKKAIMRNLLNEIQKLLQKQECEVLALDETHFSTEPYLIKGWFKKKTAVQDTDGELPPKLHDIWVLKFKKQTFLLEKREEI